MKFTFEKLGEIVFQGEVECRRCAGKKADGSQCTRTTCKYLPLCFQHLRKEMGLVVKESTIPNAGFGLFADKTFHKNDFIAPVNGERLTKRQLDERYKDFEDEISAPYAVTLKKGNIVVDGALQRWVGHFANTKTGNQGQSIRTGTNATLSIRQGNIPWLKATKTIPAGREIFLWYGRAYKVDEKTRSKTR